MATKSLMYTARSENLTISRKPNKIDASPQRQRKVDEILEYKVDQLQTLVNVLTEEKASLLVQIDALCSSQGESLFCTSSILTEQLNQLTKQLNETQLRCHSVSAEKASVQEDLLQHKRAKLLADEQSRQCMEHYSSLERDLAFYKGLCQQAIEDRDRANFKLDSTQAHVAHLESSLRESNARLEVQQSKGKELEAQLAQREASLAQLNESLVQFERLPRLRRELAGVKEQLADVEEDNTLLRGTVEQLQQQLNDQRTKNTEQQEHNGQLLQEKLRVQEEMFDKTQGYQLQMEELDEKLKAKSKEKQTVEASYHEVSLQLQTETQSKQELAKQLEEARARVAQLETQLEDQVAASTKSEQELNDALATMRDQATKVAQLSQEIIELKARLGSAADKAPAENGGLMSEAVLGKAGAPRKVLMKNRSQGKKIWLPGAPDLATQAKTAAFLGFADVGM